MRRRGAGRGVLTALTVAPLGTKMALKFVNKSKTKLKNFLREVSITNSLSSSPFIIKVFDVVFETEDCYVFAQEYAPAGDLFDIIPPQVLGWWLREGRGSSGSPSVRAEEESGPLLKSFIRRLLYISHCLEGCGYTVNKRSCYGPSGGNRHSTVSQMRH